MNDKEARLLYARMKALRDWLDEEIEAGKGEMVRRMRDNDDSTVKVRLDDGTLIAKISLTEPEPVVSTSPAFEAWFARTYPSAVRHVPEQVIPAHDELDKGEVADYLKALTWTGTEYVDDNGETPPGLTRKNRTAYPTLRFEKGARELLAPMNHALVGSMTKALPERSDHE